MRIFDKIRNIASGQRGDYTTDCSLDYLYFERILWDDSNRFKQTTSTRYWSKKNTAN